MGNGVTRISDVVVPNRSIFDKNNIAPDPGPADTLPTLPPVLDTVLIAVSTLLNIPFALKGPRSALTKVVGVDTLPVGATLDVPNKRIRFTAGATVAFTNWDFSGYCLYMDQAGVTVSATDCKFSNADQRLADIRAGSFTAQYCDFDGQRAANNIFSEMVNQSATGSTMTITDSKLRGSPEDCIKTGSNSLVERNWFYDMAYDPTGHPDVICTQLGAGGAGENIVNQTIRNNFIDARKINGVQVTCGARLMAELGTNVSGVLFENNVVIMAGISPPLYLGARTGSGASNGASASDYVIRNNFMDYNNADAIYNGGNTIPTGATAFYGNRRFTDNSLIVPPAGWPTTLNVVTPYVVLDGFDSLSGRTAPSAPATQALVTPGLIGAGAVQLSMNGALQPSLINPNIGVNEDPLNWDIVAFWIDSPNDPFNNSLSWVVPTITTNGNGYTPAIDKQYGNIDPTDWYPFTRGGRFISYAAKNFRVGGAWSGAKLTDAGAGTKQVTLRTNNANTNRNQKITFDALIRPTRTKPFFSFTMDDVNGRQHSEAAQIMQTAGQAASTPYPLVATGFMCQGLLGTSGKLTSAQALDLINTYGWTWSLDSGPNDEPFSAFASPAAAVTQLNALRDNAIAAGYCNTADAKMFCYSYGGMTYWAGTSAPNQQISITPNGTDSVVVSNSIYPAYIMAGMVAKNTGVSGANPVLVSALALGQSQVTLKFDQPIPASAARTITLCAARRGLAYTSSGGSQLTGIDTTYLVPGMTMYAAGVPDGLTILSVDVDMSTSGTVTMSGNVPTGSSFANFYLKDAPFAVGKMQDALLDAGYTLGRLGSAGGGNGVYTGYGLKPMHAIALPAISTDDKDGTTTSLNKIITEITDAYTNGRSALCYMHWNTQQSASNFNLLMQWVAARVNAGDFDVVTLREWKSRADQRLAIS